ncbi:Queuine tRNA-ribosyltransferase catalytic subunit 1 [Coelomomyces lativittatus]|nr:Queuine tRNA-ribosyltransferase catalytic subunit 1 [Coelomomyces lativittatus]
MIATRETAGCHLISIHNISYQMNLMRNIRDSIVTGQFPSFVLKFCKDMYGDSTPLWAKEALASVGIHV